MASTEMGRSAACIGALTVVLMFGAACSADDDDTLMPPITGMPMAGAFGSAGGPGAGTAGEPVAGSGGMAGLGSGAPSGPAPELPAITGECPAFTDGSTIQVAGHGGVLIFAGPPGEGGPLLFYWHGTGSTPQELTRTLPADVRDDIISQGGIIASFDGRASSGTAGDCSGTRAHNIADFEAADQIAACAVRDHGIDPRRIYTTGCSAGGLQSGCMAMVRSSYVAAAAPNSGGTVFPQPSQDQHSPAIFTMHGGPSDMVIVAFSQTSATLDMNAKTHGSFVVNCDHGGGHCRAPAELQSAAWRFMKDHPWGFTESPWAAGIPDGVPSSCTIF
jgi:predicted esterase